MNECPGTAMYTVSGCFFDEIKENLWYDIRKRRKKLEHLKIWQQ